MTAKIYFLPLITAKVVIDGPGEYLTRDGRLVTIYETSEKHGFNCVGCYEDCITEDKWHKSGRVFAFRETKNDIVKKLRYSDPDDMMSVDLRVSVDAEVLGTTTKELENISHIHIKGKATADRLLKWARHFEITLPVVSSEYVVSLRGNEDQMIKSFLSLMEALSKYRTHYPSDEEADLAFREVAHITRSVITLKMI